MSDSTPVPPVQSGAVTTHQNNHEYRETYQRLPPLWRHQLPTRHRPCGRWGDATQWAVHVRSVQVAVHHLDAMAVGGGGATTRGALTRLFVGDLTTLRFRFQAGPRAHMNSPPTTYHPRAGKLTTRYKLTVNRAACTNKHFPLSSGLWPICCVGNTNSPITAKSSCSSPYCAALSGTATPRWRQSRRHLSASPARWVVHRCFLRSPRRLRVQPRSHRALRLTPSRREVGWSLSCQVPRAHCWMEWASLHPACSDGSIGDIAEKSPTSLSRVRRSSISNG